MIPFLGHVDFFKKNDKFLSMRSFLGLFSLLEGTMSTFGNIFDRIIDQRIDTPGPSPEKLTAAQLSARLAEPEEQVKPPVKTGWKWWGAAMNEPYERIRGPIDGSLSCSFFTHHD